MKLLHSSLRYDRDRAIVAGEVERWARYAYDAVTFTEATRFRGVIQAPGYQTIQPQGHPELAALVRNGIRVHADVLQLSDRGIPRRGGEKPYALRLDLPEITVYVVHLPAGVERPGGFRRNVQAAVWRDCVRSLKAAIAREKRPGRPTWIVGDFNLNARRKWVRRFWAKHFPGFALTTPVVGTHGRRAIDYALIRDHRAIGVRTFLTAASDHRAALFQPKPKEAPVSKFITKEQWGSNTSKEATEDSHPIGTTRGITAHWEGTYVGTEPHSACAQRVRNIERSHEYGRGWGDIAYNLLVCQHGYVFEGRGADVRSAANGYTAANNSHYSVCALMGPGDAFTDAFRQGFLLAFAHLRDQGNAGPERNGHRDHKATQCPGDAIYTWVHSLPAGAGTTDRPTPTTPEEIDMTPDELRQIIREEIAAAFRGDSKRQVLDLGKARIEHPDDTETAKTLGRLLYSIRDAVKGEK